MENTQRGWGWRGCFLDATIITTLSQLLPVESILTAWAPLLLCNFKWHPLSVRVTFTNAPILSCSLAPISWYDCHDANNYYIVKMKGHNSKSWYRYSFVVQGIAYLFRSQSWMWREMAYDITGQPLSCNLTSVVAVVYLCTWPRTLYTQASLSVIPTT